LSPRDDALRRFLAARADEGWMPGAAWWVEGPAGVVSQGVVGAAAVEPEPEPATEATPFDLASLTKPLATAPLLLLLEQERRVNLDSPVEDYLPALAGSIHGRATLRALATHTSGLPAWRPLYLEAATLDRYLAAIAALPAETAPGAAVYSDLGYILLGAVAESVSGRSLPKLFMECIAAPLGLSRTRFAGPHPIAGAAATERGNAYERSLAGAAGEDHAWRTGLLRGEVHDGNAFALGGAAGHAGLFGVVDEVARLGRELLRPRHLPLEGRSRDLLLRAAPGGAGRTVGMVLASRASATRGILPGDAPGHTGFTGTSIWLDPDRERLFVLLTNRVHPRVPSREFRWLRRGFHRVARQAFR
jgi:CubicO group peptidase (beta-lactamase class C family)